MTDIEPDEATVWTRKMLEVYGLVNEGDPYFQDARQVLSELIASKDGEIELERGRFKIADEEVDNLRNELVAVRAGKADFLRRRRADYTVAELAALRAENERLKDTLNTLGTRWALRKAAERNTAEPEHCLSGEPHRKAGEVVRSAGLHSNDGSGNTAEPATEMTPDVVVTQDDIEAAKESIFYECGNQHVKADIQMSYARHRTEAEARGRREALEEALKWLRSPEGKGSDAGIDYADGFADQIERMMTGEK